MTTYIALLRAVNVGGHQAISMGDLRELAGSLGLVDPRTLLQSGNLVFRARTMTTTSIERKLEEAARDTLGLDTDFMVRAAEEWDELVDGNPFPNEARDDPGHLLVMVLKPRRQRPRSKPWRRRSRARRKSAPMAGISS